MNNNSIANLKRGPGNPNWKPGISGNPKGKPRKADCLLECVKSELRKKAINGQTNEELIASVLVAMATQGNIKAIELTLSYVATKPVSENKVELSGAVDINHDVKGKVASLITRIAAAEQAGASDTKPQ